MTVGNQTPPGGRSDAPIGPGPAPDGSEREGAPVEGRPVDDAAATRSPAPPVSLPPAVPARVTMVSRTAGRGRGAEPDASPSGMVDPARPPAAAGDADAYPASSLFEPFTPVEPFTTAMPVIPRRAGPDGGYGRPDDGTWSPGSTPVASGRGVPAPPPPAAAPAEPRPDRNGSAHGAGVTAPTYDGGSPAASGAAPPERDVERTGVIPPVTDDGDPHAAGSAPAGPVGDPVDGEERSPFAAGTSAAGTNAAGPDADTGAAGTAPTDTADPPVAGTAPDVVPPDATTAVTPDPDGTGPAPDRTGASHPAETGNAPPHRTDSPSDRIPAGDDPSVQQYHRTAAAPAQVDAPPARTVTALGNTQRRPAGPARVPSAAGPLTPPPTPAAPPTTGRLRRLPVALLAVAVLVAGLAYVGYRQVTGGPPEGWRAVTSPGYELAVPDAWTAPTAGTAPVTVFGVPFGTAGQSGEYPCGQGRYVRAVAASALIAVPADIGLDQAATAFARGAGEALYPGTGAQVAVGTPTERQLSTVTGSRVEATVRTDGAAGCRATDATIQVLVVPRTTAPDGEIGAAVLLVSGDLRGGPKEPAPPTRDELVAILDTAALAGA